MERSVLGSAVKTYGAKNRYSRSSYSYRPSGFIGSHTNVFEDDDPITTNPFDKLLHEDKTKNTFVLVTPTKNTFNGTINTKKTNKFQSNGEHHSTALKSVQNVRNDFTASTKTSTVHKFYGGSKSYANKENTLECKNQLYGSDSDCSENDVYDYSKTVGKKGTTTTKKKKKNLGLRNASRAINQTTKRKRRLEYRGKCRNKSPINSSSLKCSFVKLLTDGYGIPIRRRTLIDQTSLSLAKPLDEENTGTENSVDNFKSISETIMKCAKQLENSDQSACFPSNCAPDCEPVATSMTSSVMSSSLSPSHGRYSQFCPPQNSTPRQSAKYDLEISTRSPKHSEAPSESKSIEFDPTNPSKSFQFIKKRLSDRNKETSLCEIFEKSCSLSTKQFEIILTPDKLSESRSSKIVTFSGLVDVRAEHMNISGGTNCSQISTDAKNSSCNVSSRQSDFEIFSANNSFENTRRNDETKSQYMSIESSSLADDSQSNVTIEMKSVDLIDSKCESNVTRAISRDLFKSCSPKSNTSSEFSDSADEKYETIIQRAEITKSTGSETNRNSAYIDSLLFSVLHPSSIKSGPDSGSFRSSTASYLPSSETSSTRTSLSSPSYSGYSVETASIRSSVAPPYLSTPSPSAKSSSPPTPSYELSVDSASNCSYPMSHHSLTELLVNVSPCSSSRNSPTSDSSGSDELVLTILERTPVSANVLTNDTLSPKFTGFETNMAEIAKLAALKGELDKLQNQNSSPSTSSASSSSSLSNDSGIEETRRVGRSTLHSIEQNVMSYSRSRSSGILSSDASTRSRKSVRFDTISKFEPLLEEKAEDSTENEEANSCQSIKQPEYVPHHLQSRGNFTERRRKRCPLPTLNEADTETDEGFVGSQNSILSRISSVREDNLSLVRSPIFLAKGKKWRRSFLMLKNVRDFGFNPDLSEEENKGRCWRQNMEHLIQSQLDATVLPRELDECTVLRTGFDGKTTSGFEEGDTLTEKSIYSRRSRFSLSICVDPSVRLEISQNSILDESSLARLALESRESYLTDVNVSAGDHFRNCSLPRIDFSVPYTARDIVLRYCQQSQPLPFDECFDESVLRSCRKIGEGVYGEVFSLKTRSKSSVIKIIPIEGDQKVNGERQKRFDEILSELVISLELSNLRRREDYYTNCFAEVQRCWCVQGRYPTRLINLWKEYDQTKGSDNDSPKIFKDNQLYIILELNNGGEDLESFEFNNAQQTLSVFKQVANALAVAEQAFKFEHRDLHWGNVLVSPTRDRESGFIFGDKTRSVQLFGVKVTIIDYTLSRISINNHTLYNNIGEDPELFTAEGDFQFEVYRLMRKEVDDIWERYMPKTNVIWLYYLIDKMINEVRYRRDYTKIHLTNVNKLKRLSACVLNFESSCDLIENQPI